MPHLPHARVASVHGAQIPEAQWAQGVGDREILEHVVAHASGIQAQTHITTANNMAGKVCINA